MQLLKADIIYLDAYKYQKYGHLCPWCHKMVNTYKMLSPSYLCLDTGHHIATNKHKNWVDDLRVRGIVYYARD